MCSDLCQVSRRCRRPEGVRLHPPTVAMLPFSCHSLRATRPASVVLERRLWRQSDLPVVSPHHGPEALVLLALSLGLMPCSMASEQLNRSAAAVAPGA